MKKSQQKRGARSATPTRVSNLNLESVSAKHNSAFANGMSGADLTLKECQQIAELIASQPDLKQIVESQPTLKEQMQSFYSIQADETALLPNEQQDLRQHQALQGYSDDDGPISQAEIQQIFGRERDPTLTETKPEVKYQRYLGDQQRIEPLMPPTVATYNSAPTSGGFQPLAVPKKRSNRSARFGEVQVTKTYNPDPFLRNEAGVSPALTPSDNEDFDNVRESIQVVRTLETTNIFAVVFDKEDQDANVMSAIRCLGGNAFGGYAHDLSRDSYLVQCVECLQIGQLPFSFAITMSNIGDWQVKVPIPESVLEKHFNPQQRKVLDDYRKQYPLPRYNIHYIQMIGCN